MSKRDQEEEHMDQLLDLTDAPLARCRDRLHSKIKREEAQVIVEETNELEALRQTILAQNESSGDSDKD